jgi:hypothetical protein
MRIPFRSIVPRITGISTPVFGVSWEPPQSERQLIRKLMTFLEDRRALYNAYNLEVPEWVTESVLKIREQLTDILGILPEESMAVPPLKAMQAACRKFLDQTGQLHHRGGLLYGPDGETFFTALGELRGVFGIHIAQLCVSYRVNLGSQLEAILPEPP